MIPIRDDIPSSITPVVNYAMIGICAAVFLLQLSQGDHVDRFIEKYGMIPARVTAPDKPVMVKEQGFVSDGRFVRPVIVQREAAAPPFHPWITIFTCIFLHGGWMHFLGNMLFLYIYGDNVEDRLGHIGYLIFYVGMGVAASLSHFLTDPNSVVPTIGASGAIAGVMGAYILLYPHARVLTIIPIFYFLEFFEFPAWLLIGVWFVTQLFSGTAAITGGAVGGVAWWAHIGGFVAGAALTFGLRSAGLLKPAKARVVPHTRAFSHYRRAPW